jgi:uncharacterized protein (DUF2062 family)
MVSEGGKDRESPRWRRKLRVIWRRLRRATGSPHEVALGFAVAAFWSILPTPGLSILFGFATAAFIRMSKVSLAIGFAAFNPAVCVFLVYPWALPIGQAIVQAVPALDFEELKRLQWVAEQGLALVIGAAIAGLGIGAVSYALIRRMVTLHREKRAARQHAQWLARHAAETRAELDGE